MKVSDFLSIIDVDFYAGVPDSQLSALCNYLTSHFGISPQQHMVAANEGGAVALAAGHFLATQKPAMVYMQNSGIGNIVNPVCSLISEDVYEIPMVFVVGWRGEPGTKDEPQHVFQGKATRSLLDCINIKNVVITAATTMDAFRVMARECRANLDSGHPFAFVVSKGAFDEEPKPKRAREYPLSREKAVDIVTALGDEKSFYVSTTGKLSRELFEIRERRGQAHDADFLTVGSMGHSIMIALGVAAAARDKKIYCLDGDGALLMHMGSMAVAASSNADNLIHIVFNNAAHESVGGIPTIGDKVDFVRAAQACGYVSANRAVTADELIRCVNAAVSVPGPHFIEIMINMDVRKDLGRPVTTPKQNRDAFMKRLITEAKD